MVSTSDLADMRGWKCEICGHATRQLERHHCFLHRSKKYPEFDDERNLQLVCHNCHQTTANSYENREAFWKVQEGRYPDMVLWYFSLPVKGKLENYA